VSREAPRLHVRTVADADAVATPVVFLHGSWHASWVWNEWLPRFASAGYYPLAPDLRGHGKSEGSWKNARLADYVGDTIRLLGDLRRPPILIGHSFGGLIVQHLLARATYPAAVLIAPIPGRYPPRVIGRVALRHPLVMARATLTRDLEPLVATPALVREALFTADTPDETVRACHARLTGASSLLFREMVQNTPDPPIPGTPTALLAPAADRSFRPEMQRRLAEKLSAELFALEGAGHDAPLEPSAPEVIELVLGWLRAWSRCSAPEHARMEA
jgi:pimeloyl-ACP methyl ester carboxylesterase